MPNISMEVKNRKIRCFIQLSVLRFQQNVPELEEEKIQDKIHDNLKKLTANNESLFRRK